MVRETRYLWAGNLPDKVTEEDLAQHFQRYGKIQSVKFLSEDGGKAAVVAFMDIKSASKAHATENKIEGKIVETQYTEASGKGTKVTRTAFETETVPVTNVQPPTSRYDVPNPGYEGYAYGSYYSSGSGSRDEMPPETQRWAGSGEADYYQQQERGRPRQRYPPPQPPPYKGAAYSQHKQFEGHYAAPYDKYGSSQRGKAGQSPGKPEVMLSRSTVKALKGYGDSPSRSRSSSSSSSGSHSTSTSHSRRSSSKASKERKRSSVVIPVRKKEDTEKLGLMLRGFPPRSSDTSIRDGLFHEYKKCGKVMSVSMSGEKENRYAIVTFKKAEDASKALEQARAKVFFGRKVTAEPHEGVDDSEADYRPPEAELDEYHHKATRTLFVGNLQLDISKETLKEIFRRYGLILDVDIKNQQPNQVFAFVQFDNIKSVVHALHEMDGETVGSSKIKLGFGRSMPTNVLWVDNVTEQVQESYLKRQFCRVGPVNYVLIDRETCRALVFYDSNELALASLSAMRGRALASKKIQIDFASSQCTIALMDNMEATSQLRPEDRPDQKGFRQYPPPATTTGAETTTYEERPGYDRSKGFYYEGGTYRGRGGKFRGQYVSRGGRSYYAGYEEGYKGKRYEEGYEEEGSSGAAKYEDFDRELREYGHKQKERSDVEEDSPPYTRLEYKEYKDDLQDSRERVLKENPDTLDKESTASYRSDKKHEAKVFEDKYMREVSVEDRKREPPKVRGGYSPNSEYSHRGSTNQRSPSDSPGRVSRRVSRDVAHAYSPSSPSRHSSPELLTSPKKVPKDYKDKLEQKQLQDYTPSTTLISEIQRTRPRKHSLKRASESDLSELDKALQRGDLFESPPKKRQAREENMDRSSRDNEPGVDYSKKVEREQSGGRKNLSGSHSMDYSGAIVDNSRDVRTKNNTPHSVQYGHRASSQFIEPPEMESKFSTPSPSTKSTKSESDKTPDSSERHSAVSSHSSGDMAQLEKEKQRLLSELHDIEDGGSVSDGEIREEDEEAKSKKKKPRLGEVFDLDWSPSEMSMKKWREEAIRREREKQTCDGQENKEPYPKNSHTEPPPKPPEPGDSANSNKFKPIDTKKSFRKQMEAMRKEHEQDTASRHSQDSKNGEGPGENLRTPLAQDTEMADNILDNSSAGKTPRHDAEFRKKAASSTASGDFPKVKGQRSYRTTCTDEMAFGGSDDRESKTRDKSNEQKARRYSDVDKTGKSPAVNRCESGDSKVCQEGEKDHHSTSRRTSRESSETGRKDGHSRRDRSGDSSVKKSHRDLRSEPCIIPEYAVKAKDGDKRVVLPADPRKKKGMRRESPMSLPLPKFSKYVKKGVSPKRPSRSHSSPKGQDQSLASTKMGSPLFSPDMSPRRLSRRDSYERSSSTTSAKTPPYQTTGSGGSNRTDKRNELSTKIASMDKEDEQTEQSRRESVEKRTVSNSDTLHSTNMDIDSERLHVYNVKSESSVEPVPVKGGSGDDKHLLVTTGEQSTKPVEITSEVAKESLDTALNIETEIKKELDNIKTKLLTVPKCSELDSSSSSLKDLPTETVKEEPIDKQAETITETSSPSKSNLIVNVDSKQAKTVTCSEDVGNKIVKESTGIEVEESSSVLNTTNSQQTVNETKKELKESPTTKSVPVSPSAEKRVSDSDTSDQDSAMLQSFDECIRALDEKLEQASSIDIRRTPSDSPSGQSTPTLSAPYRDRFKVRKRVDSNVSISSVSSGAATNMSASTDTKGQPSDIVRSLLSRSSIFDQDTKRLEQIDEKYQPKEYNLNLDRPTVTVGINSDHEEDLSSSSLDSRVKDLYGLTQPKLPQFPSSVMKSTVGDSFGFSATTAKTTGLSSFDDDTATDGFGLGPSLTLTPPGSSANQDLANKFGPQTLSRYPFLSKKTALDLSKTSPPQMGISTIPEGLKSPPILPRDPRRDPTSPPVMVPLSLLRKTPPSQSMGQPGGPSPLSSPTGILRKSEPGPSILKRSEPTTPPTSILKKIENTDQLKCDGFASPPFKRLDERLLLSNNSEKIDPGVSGLSSHKSSNDNADTQTPSGTGKTAVSHIEPENSAVSKNEFCSGDGVQYQSTPSPPVLTKEVKDATSQGIGSTVTPLKRTASQAFLDKAEKESVEQRSPPTLTQPPQLEECKTNTETDERKPEISSPGIPEPEAKKPKVISEVKEQQGPAETEKGKEGDIRKTSTSSSAKSTGKVHEKSEKKNALVKKGATGNSVDKSEKKTTDNKKGSVKPVLEVRKKTVPDNNEKKSVMKKSGWLGNEKRGDPRSSAKDSDKRLSEKKTISDEKKVSDTRKEATSYSSKKTDSLTSERKDKNGPIDRKETSDKKVSETDRKVTDGKKVVPLSDVKKGTSVGDKKTPDKAALIDDKKVGDKVQEKGSNASDKKSTEKSHSGSNDKCSEKKPGDRWPDKPGGGNHKASESSNSSEKVNKVDRRPSEVCTERKTPDTADKTVKKSSSDKHSSDKKSSPNEKKSEKGGVTEKSTNSERKLQPEDRKVKVDIEKKSKSQAVPSTVEKKSSDKPIDKGKKLDAKSKESSSSSKSLDKVRHASDNSSSSSLGSDTKSSQQQQQLQKEQKVVKNQAKVAGGIKDGKSSKPESQRSEKKPSSSAPSDPKNKVGFGSSQGDGKSSKGVNEGKTKVNSHHQVEVKAKSGSNSSHEVKTKSDVKPKSSSSSSSSGNGGISQQSEGKNNKCKSETPSNQITSHSKDIKTEKDMKTEKVNLPKVSTGMKPKIKTESKSPTTKSPEKFNKVAEVLKEEVNDKHLKSVKMEKVIVKPETKVVDHKREKGDLDHKREKGDLDHKREKGDLDHKREKGDLDHKREKGDLNHKREKGDKYDRRKSEKTHKSKNDKYDRHRDGTRHRDRLFSKDKKKDYFKVDERSRCDVWKASMENKIMKDSRDKHREDRRRMKHEIQEERNHHKSSRGGDQMEEQNKISPRRRSSSIAGETRELKQLRESLGIPADEPLQFTSMYDMVKRRTHREVQKDEVFSPEKPGEMKLKKRRGSYDTSNSDSDEDSDSAFSSENKENKKNQSKSQMKTKTFIMSTSSDEFSSDDSSKHTLAQKTEESSKNTLAQKTSPVFPPKKKTLQRRKSVITNSSSQSSDSSAESSDSDISVRKTPTQKPGKRRAPVLASDSDSAESDCETVQKFKTPVKKPDNNKSKVNAKDVERNKRPTGNNNKIRTSSSESSSESDSESDDERVKRMGQTVLEKLEESIRMSSDGSASSDSSDSSVASPPKPALIKGGKQTTKKISAKHSSDSDDMPALKKKSPSGVKSQWGKNVNATSESDSDQSSASDHDVTKRKNTVKPSPKAVHKEQAETQHKPPKKETPPQKSKKPQSPSVSLDMRSKVDKSDQPKKKSPVGKQSPKGLKIDTDMKKEVNKLKPHKEITSPKSTEMKRIVQDKVKKSKETMETPITTIQQEEKKFSSKATVMESDSKISKEEPETSVDENAEDLNTSNVSDLTEEEKGREEKVNKMQSIFSKSDNIFEKLDFDNDSTKVSSDTEQDQTESEKVEPSPCENFSKIPSDILSEQQEQDKSKKVLKVVNTASTKLFDTSDSESEAEVKQIAEKIIVGGDESQDSEILDQVPLLEPEGILKESVKPEIKVEASKKIVEVPTSEPVKNTVVETEKAVNSLVTLLEEVPAPTINETGIVENVEIITEPVDEDEEEKEERVDQVAQDEVANAILSISKMCDGLEESNAIAILQQPDIGVHIDEGNQESSGQMMFQIEHQENSEAEQAVAALVLDCAFGEKPVEENYAQTVNTQEVSQAVCEAAPEQAQETHVFAPDKTPAESPSHNSKAPTIVPEEHSEGKQILQSIVDEINIVPSGKDVVDQTENKEASRVPLPLAEKEVPVEHKVQETQPLMVNDLKINSSESKELKQPQVVVETPEKQPQVSTVESAWKSPTEGVSVISQDSSVVKTISKQEDKPAAEKSTKKSVPQKPGRRHHEAYVPAVSSFEQLFPNIRNETRTKVKETQPKEPFNVITPQPIPHSQAVSLPNDYPGKNMPTTKSIFNTDMAGNLGIPSLYNHTQQGLNRQPDLYKHTDKNIMNGPHMPSEAPPQYLQKPPEFPPNSMFPHQRGQHHLNSPLFQQRDMQLPNRPRQPFQPQPKSMEPGFFSKAGMKEPPSNNFMGMEQHHPQDHMANALFQGQKGVSPETKGGNMSFYNPKVGHQPEKLGNQQFFGQNFVSPKDKKLNSPPFYGNKKSAAEEPGNSHLYGQKPAFPPASEPYQHLIVKPPIDHIMQHSASRQPEPARMAYAQQAAEKKRQGYASHNFYEKPGVQNSLYEMQKERFSVEKTNYPQIPSKSPVKSDVVKQEKRPEKVETSKQDGLERAKSISSENFTNQGAFHGNSSIDSLLHSVKTKDHIASSVMTQIPRSDNHGNSKQDQHLVGTQIKQQEAAKSVPIVEKVSQEQTTDKYDSTKEKVLSEGRTAKLEENEHLNNTKKELKRYEPKSRPTDSVDVSPVKQSTPVEEAQVNHKDDQENVSDKVDYMIPSNSVQESDTDREKEEDEEAKDNIQYEKEPEKECISIEGLNDFEDEEDLPDLIIDESPLPRKSADDDTENKKASEVKTDKTADNKPESKGVSAKHDITPTSVHEKPLLIPNENNFKAKFERDIPRNEVPGLTTQPKTKEVNEVSLNVGEELLGRVLHIEETENVNLAQPKLAFPTVNLMDNSHLPYQPKPGRKMRVKGKKNQNGVIESEAIDPGPLLIETTASLSGHMEVTPSDKTPEPHPTGPRQGLVKSPVTRGKSMQEDMPVSEPTTPPASKKRQDSAESPGKFSSRGRKIIPKERGDEITELTRKSRRSASTGSAASDETKVKTKIRTGSATPVAPENNSVEDQSGGVLGKKKTWSLRSQKEAEVQDSEPKDEVPVPVTSETIPKEPKEEQKEPPIKITLRRTGRRKTTIQKTTNQDGSAAPEVAEYRKVSEDPKATTEESAMADQSEQPEQLVDTNHRPKRHRKAKGKKGADSTGPVTRTRRNEGSSSPRSKSSDGSSPKNIAKSYVKLEKLHIDSSKNEEDQKDLYEWEDEEEKPLPGYKVARNTRKRKGSDKRAEALQKPGVDQPKRSKKAKVEAKKDLKESLDSKEALVDTVALVKSGLPEPLPEKKEPPPEPRKPDMTDILQDKRGHLPLKLAMKLKSQEAARKENEAKEAAEKAAREQTEQQQNALKLGGVNEGVKDSFEKSEEARIIDKKRGRFMSRDEQFSPGVKDLSWTGATTSSTSGQPTGVIASTYSNRPPSVSVATTSAEMPSPIVISPAPTVQQACRPPSAPTAGMASSRAGLTASDPVQTQAIVRAPNPQGQPEQFGLSQNMLQDVIAHNRPSSQPSGAKMSPKHKAAGRPKADSRQSPHLPISAAGHPPHMMGQSLHSTAQQLSPHSVRGPSPRMPVPPPHLAAFSHPFPPPGGLPPPTSPTSQASELRAALAQPSKLVQQEQLLQHQQRLQERQPAPQHSPHLPEASKGSPSLPPGLGLPPPHCIPFSVSEQHQARVDNKVSSHSVISPHIAAPHEAVRPDLTSFRPELALAHRDIRNGLPQMMIPGMPPMFIPGMAIDPRMIQHQHELIAQQQMLGMLPPHGPPPHALLGQQQQQQQQPPVADRHPHDQSSGGRPPSRHTTPPIGQPSPRVTPHHPQQVSTPLTPQLPQPPMAALPSRPPPMAHMPNGIPSDGMAIALQRFPVMWQGYLYLKNDAANVQMHFITGSKQLVTGALESVVEGGIVRIAQRMRLEASQLEGVAKRMQKEEEYSMLVAIPCGKDHVDILHQSNKLQTGFIQYLQQKQAAGIVNIPVQPGYVVHIFPPCQFSSINITQKAPELVRNLNDNSYLVVVITST